MTDEQKIKNALAETYDTQKEFTTTIKSITKLVKEKYPESKEDDIETTLSKMKGWERAGETLEDQAKISPSFFD